MNKWFLNHYSKNYLVKSKYINELYNLSLRDIESAKLKLKRQLDYVSNTYVDSVHNDGESLSLLDFSYACNLRPDIYISELLNRVDTLKRYALREGYDCPIFLTITPHPEFKPMKVVRLPKKEYDLMVDNPVFTGDFWNYTNDCRLDIGHAFSKFQRDQIFKDIKKSHGHTPIYFSTWEPYIDGSLHKHILMFIPSQYKSRMLKRISYHLQDRMHDVKFVSNDETNIDQSISYILKYVTKTFTHSKTDEISLETLFYIKHGLRRFTTSRTLAPLFLYRLSRNEINYLEFTDQYHNDDLYCEGIKRENGSIQITSIVNLEGNNKTSYLYYRPS